MPDSYPITSVHAREVFDSRGRPTVEVEIGCANAPAARVIVPSGASTGQFEAVELRDGDAARLGGLGVRRAVDHVRGAIATSLLGQNAADQQAIVTKSLASIMDQPWYALLLGAAERVFAITAHLAMSLMVLQVFLRRSLRWLFLSIGYHTLLNALAVVVITKAGPYAAEGALAVFSLLSLFIIFKLRTPEPEPVEPEPLPETDLPLLVPTDDAIDRSKYG